MEAKLPECGVSVEMANHLFTLLDFLKEVSLAGHFSVLPVSFRKPFLSSREAYDPAEMFFGDTWYFKCPNHYIIL